MADFESIIKQHIGDDGNIPSTAIATIVTAIKTAVGNEFVDKTRYKSKLDEIDELKTKQQTAEDNATTAEKWKTKYDALKGDFEAYKTDVTKKETAASKTKAYKELLKELNISDKVIDKVVKLADIDSLEIVDGKIKDAETLSASLKAEWGDFIATDKTKGGNVEAPPANRTADYDKMSDEDYYKTVMKKE